MIGSRARVFEVLTGKRPLTLEMVRRVRGCLGISADLLIPSDPASKNAYPSSRTRTTKTGSQENRPKGGTDKGTISASA